MIEYFDISYSIKNNIPVFNIKLKKEFTSNKGYPKKKASGKKEMPVSSSSIEYFAYYFEDDLAKDLFSFRKKFFNITNFIEYLSIPDCDMDIINNYFSNIKKKEKENHNAVVQTDEYRSKLRVGASRDREGKRARLVEKFKNKDNKDRLIKNIHSEEAIKKRILSFKKSMSKEETKKCFLEKIRSKEVSDKKSASLKKRWALLSDDEKKVQINNLRYKKNYELSGKKMNLNEFLIGSILNDLSIEWEYEPKIDYINNSFYPDFLIKKNIIIECYGTYWHADPRKFKRDDIFFKKYKAEDIWIIDSIRVDKLKSIGYNVVIFWEEDIHNNSEKIKEEIRGIYERICL